MPVIHIFNGTIIEISTQRNTTFVTITYRERSGRPEQSERPERPGNPGREQTVRLVVGPRTIILNDNGRPVRPGALRVGMTVNAVISSAMTRSIPPQATAYVIQIVRRERQEEVTTGRIQNVDRDDRNFTTISDRNPASIIRFNVSENTRFFDSMGRRINFAQLRPGMRVRVWHANFMTASIPPQTTAFEVRIL